MQNAKKKTGSVVKKTMRNSKCNPLNCEQCIYLSMLQTELKNKGKEYGKIHYIKKDGKFLFTYYDKNVAKMLGYSAKELIGQDISILLHPADKKMMMQRAKDRMQGKKVDNEYITRLKRKDGTCILAKIIGTPPNTSKGYPEVELIIACLPIPKARDSSTKKASRTQ
jgi:PAS domain S-box-containing protein